MTEIPKVFLCYAHEDKPIIDDVYRLLREAGLSPWMDKPPHPHSTEGLQPGELWDRRIREAVKTADYFLAFLSPLSVSKRGFVQREYRLALDRMNEVPAGDVFLIPVLLAECVPPAITVGQVSFTDIQWYELYTRGIHDLIEYMKKSFAIRQRESIVVGKRLVLDFGTSNSAVVFSDFGGGTTDISTSRVAFQGADEGADTEEVN